jgi:hypothetical protein
MGAFLTWLLSAFGGTIIESVINSFANAFRLRRLDRERDENIVGRERAEQRAANAEAQTKITKDMLNAQVKAPGSRSDLVDRLRAEGAAEAGTSPKDE